MIHYTKALGYAQALKDLNLCSYLPIDKVQNNCKFAVCLPDFDWLSEWSIPSIIVSLHHIFLLLSLMEKAEQISN